MGLTVLPRNEDGNLGRDKKDLDAVPELDHFVPAQEYNNLVDRVCELGEAVGLEDGSTSGSLTKRVGDLESGSGSSALLWEWNGTDTSQFDAAEVFGPGDTTLSVVARSDVPGGQCLKFARPAGSGASAAIPAVWLVKASELTLPAKYLVEIVYREATTSTGRGGGLCLMADPDHVSGLHAYVWTFLREQQITRIDAGVASSSTPYASQNLVNTHIGGVIDLKIESSKSPGSVPRWWVMGHALYPYLNTGTPPTMSTAPTALGTNDHQFDESLGAPPSSWETVNANRFGLGLWHVSGSVVEDFFELAALRVLKHPRDL